MEAWNKTAQSAAKKAAGGSEQNTIKATGMNINELKTDVLLELEEWALLHNEDCPCVTEQEDACECNMSGLKPFVADAMSRAYQKGMMEGLKPEAK